MTWLSLEVVHANGESVFGFVKTFIVLFEVFINFVKAFINLNLELFNIAIFVGDNFVTSLDIKG